MKFHKLLVSVITSLGLISSSHAFSTLDADLPDYESTTGVSGKLFSVGSDTLANLMTLWAEEFKREYPNVNIEIQAAGSSSAPPALTEGIANLGPMSREMTPKELKVFEARYGYKPMAIPVAIDALAVYVHKDNPIKGMSIADVDAVFSRTHRCGAAKDISKWDHLIMDGSWSGHDIQLFGRDSVSGTYGYFRKEALCDGDFKRTVNEQLGSAAVVQAVSSSLYAIGYSGIGYKTSGVRALPLSEKTGDPYVEATRENAVNNMYPLSRFLYLYVNKHPNKPLAPLDREFIKLVLSKSGQEIVIKDGYIPLPVKVAKKILKEIE